MSFEKGFIFKTQLLNVNRSIENSLSPNSEFELCSILGHGSFGRVNKVNTPQKVQQKSKVVNFTCGEEHSAYIDTDGHVHTWGLGIDGQLGHGNKNSQNLPTKIQF